MLKKKGKKENWEEKNEKKVKKPAKFINTSD